ncbi:hypothetical protein ACFE04_005756 [Oxalis oulophora]
MAEKVKLFKTWSSPFGLRVVWALKLKDISYDPIDEDISNKSDLLFQYNPVHKKVPVLLHNGKPICESLTIVEYIDETWRQHPLLPEDTYEKAKARFFAKFSDDKLMPSMWGIFLKEGKEQEESILTAFKNLNFLEANLEGNKFFGGNMIGYLDIALGWLANLVPVLEEISGLKIIDADRFPRLYAWKREFAEDSLIKETWPPHDKMVAKFIAMRQTISGKAPPK